jgi:predicted transcriptional regulator
MEKRPTPERLSARERQILNAVFGLQNRASAEEIRARLLDPPSYSAVRVMLSRLEAKGYLRHTVEGPRYIYSATVSPQAARKSALQQYLRTFFSGSLAQMVISLVRQGSWTDEELDELKTEIERARKERTR